MVTNAVGSWRNWQTRHAQTVQIGVRIPASRPTRTKDDHGATIPLRREGTVTLGAS